jgi:hypothetical protein
LFSVCFSARRKARRRPAEREKRVLARAEFWRSPTTIAVESTLMRETAAPAALNFGQLMKARTTPQMPSTWPW